MMKRLTRLIPLLLAAAFAVACDFDTYENVGLATSISVKPAEYTCQEAAAGSVSFEVQASGDWIIIAPAGVTVTPKDGTGATTISAFVPDNRGTGAAPTQPRTFTISVCGTDTVVPFRIHQPGSGE